MTSDDSPRAAVQIGHPSPDLTKQAMEIIGDNLSEAIHMGRTKIAVAMVKALAKFGSVRDVSFTGNTIVQGRHISKHFHTED